MCMFSPTILISSFFYNFSEKNAVLDSFFFSHLDQLIFCWYQNDLIYDRVFQIFYSHAIVPIIISIIFCTRQYDR